VSLLSAICSGLHMIHGVEGVLGRCTCLGMSNSLFPLHYLLHPCCLCYAVVQGAYIGSEWLRCMRSGTHVHLLLYQAAPTYLGTCTLLSYSLGIGFSV
jgi:hypothetical protein